MANVIPSIRVAPRPVYTPRARTTTTTQSGSQPDFLTLLKKQPTVAAAPPATVATQATASVNPGTLGSVTVGTAAPVVNPAPVESPAVPTAESVFGSNPWITNAGGNGPNGQYGYNKYYFATPETAAKVAQMLGGTVVAANDLTPYGPFVQNQANQMIQMPDGRLINAGIIASYYDHGWSQKTIDTMVNGEIAGSSSIHT